MKDTGAEWKRQFHQWTITYLVDWKTQYDNFLVSINGCPSKSSSILFVPPEMAAEPENKNSINPKSSRNHKFRNPKSNSKSSKSSPSGGSDNGTIPSIRPTIRVAATRIGGPTTMTSRSNRGRRSV